MELLASRRGLPPPNNTSGDRTSRGFFTAVLVMVLVNPGAAVAKG